MTLSLIEIAEKVMDKMDSGVKMVLFTTKRKLGALNNSN